MSDDWGASEKLLTESTDPTQGERLSFPHRGLWSKDDGLMEKPTGTEMFLDTDVGRVRVLAYGLDDPTVRLRSS